jgi:hypothetical protein
MVSAFCAVYSRATRLPHLDPLPRMRAPEMQTKARLPRTEQSASGQSHWDRALAAFRPADSFGGLIPTTCGHRSGLNVLKFVWRLEPSEQRNLHMVRQKSRLINWEPLLSAISAGKSPKKYAANCKIFEQGQSADSLLYILVGKVKLTVVSKHGKEATIAVMSVGDFLGEGCLAGQRLRTATATAITDCTLHPLAKSVMTRTIHEQHEISELFVLHLLASVINKRIN